MWLVTVGILIAAGILGASNIIVGKKPNAQELIDKLTPYQGWLGVVMFIWGIWDLISVLGMLSLIGQQPLFVIIYIVVVVVEIGLGFLLGFGLITKYALSKNETAMEKGQQIRAKLAKFQGPLGLTAIVLGILFLVLRFI